MDDSHSDRNSVPAYRSDPDLVWTGSDPGAAEGSGTRSSDERQTVRESAPRVSRAPREPIDAEYEPAGPRTPPPAAGRDADGDPTRALAVADARAYRDALPEWLDVREHEVGPNAPRDLVMLRSPNSLAAQQFRTLRYRIEQEPDAQILAVVSARPAEGKSVTAANLALALAEGGRVRVLLVDAAIRAPRQAALFALDGAPGLTTAIQARRDDPGARVLVHRIPHSTFVLPAGPRVGGVHAILGSEAAARLLGAFRRAFRYVVVDSAAVFGPAETLAWHGMIDRYVLVARQGSTTLEDLGKAADRIDRDKILGVTFVGASWKSIGAP